MADRYSGRRLRIRPWRDDHQWPARAAKPEDVSVCLLAIRAVRNLRNWQQRGGEALDEALDVIDVIFRAYQRQLQRQSYLQCTYQRQLRHERNLRRTYQAKLRNERTRRREYEQQLQRQRIYYEQEIRAAAEAHGDALYGAKVAKLVNLAVCAESDAEATAALAKARTLHRLVGQRSFVA